MNYKSALEGLNNIMDIIESKDADRWVHCIYDGIIYYDLNRKGDYSCDVCCNNGIGEECNHITILNRGLLDSWEAYKEEEFDKDSLWT